MMERHGQISNEPVIGNPFAALTRTGFLLRVTIGELLGEIRALPTSAESRRSSPFDPSTRGSGRICFLFGQPDSGMHRAVSCSGQKTPCLPAGRSGATAERLSNVPSTECRD